MLFSGIYFKTPSSVEKNISVIQHGNEVNKTNGIS